MKYLGVACATLLVAVAFVSPAMAERRAVIQTTVGEFQSLEKGPATCVCGTDSDSQPFCAIAVECAGLSVCEMNSDCDAGYQCLVENCCAAPLDAGACVPVCDSDGCINPGICTTYDSCEPPLFVALYSFDVEYRNGSVVVSWTTSTEIDNIGFRILRARAIRQRSPQDAGSNQAVSAPVSLELVMPRIMPAQGMGLSGSSYTYTDASPKEAGTYSYYLEDIDTRGKATLHGPVTIVVPVPSRVRPEGRIR